MTKKLKSYFSGLVGILLIAAVNSSCEKTFDEKTVQQQDFTNSSIVQVLNTVVASAGNQLFVDTKQVSGTAMAYGSIFPSTGYGFVVSPGLRAFLITGSSPQPALSFAENLQPGKHYTIFQYDSLLTPKQKTVLDDIVIPSDTTTRIRLANFLFSTVAIPAVDVFSFVRNANLFTNVNVTDVTPFIQYGSFVSDTLYFRDAGTTNTFLKLTLTNSLVPKRSYTLLLRGSVKAQTRTVAIVATR